MTADWTFITEPDSPIEESLQRQRTRNGPERGGVPSRGGIYLEAEVTGGSPEMKPAVGSRRRFGLMPDLVTGRVRVPEGMGVAL
jgi:hypothetical protein